MVRESLATYFVEIDQLYPNSPRRRRNERELPRYSRGTRLCNVNTINFDFSEIRWLGTFVPSVPSNGGGTLIWILRPPRTKEARSRADRVADTFNSPRYETRLFERNSDSYDFRRFSINVNPYRFYVSRNRAE